MKYGKILLPVDLTARNKPAVDCACELLDPKGSITLLHVVETLDLPYEEMSEFYEQLADTASQRMKDIVSQHLGDTNTDCEVVFGRRTRSILWFAAENDADLIVMTSHRIAPNDERGRLMGISHQVAIFAPCSVILLR